MNGIQVKRLFRPGAFPRLAGLFDLLINRRLQEYKKLTETAYRK